MTVIERIGTAVPPFRHSQQALQEFLSVHLTVNGSKSHELIRRMAVGSGIEARYSVLPDFSLPPDKWTLMKPAEEGFSAGFMETRMQAFFQHAPGLSLQAVDDLGLDIKGVSHLIVVTCTGLAAPGLDLMLCEALGLKPEVSRSAIHFMGCYAAIHGLKQADFICRADPDARVLLVCTELCTLHIRADSRPDNLASTLLFGDGAAAVLITSRERAHSGFLYHIEQFASVFIPEEKKQMAWQADQFGFRMDLGMYVPDLLGNGIGRLLEKVLNGSMDDISGWAIHPGGRKILDKVSDGLGLAKEQLASSYRILRDFGNMSSPTVLFVLKEEHRRMKSEGKKGRVFSAAFGPGLTMESVLLNHVEDAKL
jgi:predicted naringenin-chalcone synthase